MFNSNKLKTTCQDIDISTLIAGQHLHHDDGTLNPLNTIIRSTERYSWIKRFYLLQQILTEISNPYSVQADHRKSNMISTEQWIVNLIGDILGFKKVFILLPNNSDNSFHISGGYGIPQEKFDHIVFPIKQGICGHVYDSKMPHLASTTVKDGWNYCNHYLDIEGIEEAKSELATPIILNSRVIGVLDVQSNKYNAFSVEDIIILSALASAIALKMETEYKESEDVAALTIIEEAASSTLYGKSFMQLSDEFTRRLVSQFHPDVITLYRLAPGTAYPLTPPFIFGELHAPNHIGRNYLSANSILFYLFSTWRPEFYPESQKNKLFIAPLDEKAGDGKYERFVIRENIKATVFMPLGTFEERVGILFMNYRRSIDFDKRQMIELQAISNMYAIQLLIAQQRELRESSLFHDSAEIHTEFDLKLFSLLSQLERSLESDIDKKKILLTINRQLHEMLDDVLLQLSFRTGKFEELNSLEKRIDQFVSTLKRATQGNLNIETTVSQGISYSGTAINQAIYAIICEAMLNSVKHGAATKLRANITKSSEAIRIEVDDNGKGFDVKQKAREFELKKSNTTKKISGIFARLEDLEILFGATAKIESSEDMGSKVTAVVPLIEEVKNGYA